MMRVSFAFGIVSLVALACLAQTPVSASPPVSTSPPGCPPETVCTPYVGGENLGGAYAPDIHATATPSSPATMNRCQLPLAQPAEAPTSFPACKAPRRQQEEPSLEVAALKLPGSSEEIESPSGAEPGLPDSASATRLALLENKATGRHGDRKPIAVYPIRFPYTPRQKFGLFIRDIYDPFNLVGEGFNALWLQSQGEPHAYGGGIGGYGKRFGAIVATDIVGEFTGTFLFPSIFHTDPRYFRMARGSLPRRFFYAISRQLIVKSDSGDDTFNSAKFLSGIVTTTVSNSYYPGRDRSFPGIVQHTLTNMAFDSLNDAFREFWPDVAHGLHIPAFVIRRTADPTFIDPMDPKPMPIDLEPSGTPPPEKNPPPSKPGLPKNLQ
jgi:hypothetical protein